MDVIAGLGNPGRRYENTRHNMGFQVIDRLAARHGIPVNKIKHKSLVGEGFIAGRKVLLVKPQTYMNLSGEAVREILDYYKTDPARLLVIYDDIDLPPGKIRVRAGGSAGTHNGMRSVLYQIRTDRFPRIRVGIGRDPRMDLADFVTGNVGKEEWETVEAALDRAAEAAEMILEKGPEAAMGEYNGK